MKRTEKFAHIAKQCDDFEKIDRILDQINELAAEIKKMSESLFYIARHDIEFDCMVHEEIDRIIESKEE